MSRTGHPTVVPSLRPVLPVASMMVAPLTSLTAHEQHAYIYIYCFIFSTSEIALTIMG